MDVNNTLQEQARPVLTPLQPTSPKGAAKSAPTTPNVERDYFCQGPALNIRTTPPTLRIRSQALPGSLVCVWRLSEDQRPVPPEDMTALATFPFPVDMMTHIQNDRFKPPTRYAVVVAHNDGMPERSAVPGNWKPERR